MPKYLELEGEIVIDLSALFGKKEPKSDENNSEAKKEDDE